MTTCSDCGFEHYESTDDRTIGEVIADGDADDVDSACQFLDRANSSECICPACGSENFEPLT